jgi:predicted transcriptional regulator of viral defense system
MCRGVWRVGGASSGDTHRDICGVDRRCCTVVQRVLKRLEERGLARRHKQGVYLIERSAAEEVLSALRQWI